MKLIKKGKIENGENIIASYKGYFKLGGCYKMLKKFVIFQHSFLTSAKNSDIT